MSFGKGLATAAACVAFASGVDAEELLANPGFEQVIGQMPAHWNVYVEPQDGSESRLDRQRPLEGSFCVRLHNATPYPKEPANNWSQNVIEELGGATLRVSGSIRTRDATEAAIWLQSFRRRPWGVLGQATTSAVNPVYGTTDWTRVEMTVDVPKGCDFVVLRCVLKGVGTAWFDGLSISRVITEKQEVEQEAKPDELSDDDAPVDSDPAPPVASDPEVDIEIESVEEALLDAYRELGEANTELRMINAELLTQMIELQQELMALRTDLDTLAEREGPAPIAYPPPPLVPHGYQWPGDAQ